MPDQPSPRRRFQFRLRTLMIGVTLLSVVCGYVAHEAKIMLERKALLESGRLSLVGQVAEETRRIPWLRARLGDVDCWIIALDDKTSDLELERVRSSFPEADVRRLHDQTQISDAGLRFAWRRGAGNWPDDSALGRFRAPPSQYPRKSPNSSTQP
jgi:hypothetical protein